MKTTDIRNNKKFGEQFAYILDAINVADIDGNEIEATDCEKVKYFFECFEKEYNYDYNRKLYPNEADRIASYIQGLPSCIGIAFTYYDIINIGKSWGYCETEKKEDDFCDRWFKVIAFRLEQLKKHFNI